MSALRGVLAIGQRLAWHAVFPCADHVEDGSIKGLLALECQQVTALRPAIHHKTPGLQCLALVTVRRSTCKALKTTKMLEFDVKELVSLNETGRSTRLTSIHEAALFCFWLRNAL